MFIKAQQPAEEEADWGTTKRGRDEIDRSMMHVRVFTFGFDLPCHC